MPDLPANIFAAFTMISKINKLLLAFALVGLTLYVVLNNPGPAEVYLGEGARYTSSMGVVLIVVFSFGILIASLVGVFFGMKHYFRERSLLARERQRELFFEKLVEARAALASKNWSRAQALWEQLVRKDPTNIIARVELSRSLEKGGDPKEALRVLDEARALHPSSTEVLYRAAELNLALGNKTAALDNLSLILEGGADRRALELGMNIAEELDRLDAALSMFSRLEGLGVASPDDGIRLRFKKLLSSDVMDKEAHRDEALAFARKHPAYVPAMVHCARVDREAGRREEAAQWYLKAAKSSGSIAHYREAIDMWLHEGMQERALAVARAAKNELKGSAKLEADLLAVRLYLSLEHLDEARRALDDFPLLVQRIGVTPDADSWREYHILRGGYLAASGQLREAAEMWRQLDEATSASLRALLLKPYVSPDEPPSPTMSIA